MTRHGDAAKAVAEPQRTLAEQDLANFVALVDPDPTRRRRFVESTRPRLAPIDGLEAGEAHAGPLSLLWVHAAHTPVDAASDGESLALVLGDVAPAKDVLVSWKEDRATPYDGFHAAFAWDPQRGLRAAADPLGLFPIVYWSAGDVALVASSPDLLRRHPGFRCEVDREGLVGLLLLNGLFDGRTLLRGVRRLSASHALQGLPATGLREVADFEPRFAGGSETFRAQVDRVHEGVRELYGRQLRTGLCHAVTLSGGLDSRVSAAYAAGLGAPLTTLTLGEVDDLEARCAQGVARVLGAPHQVVPDPDEAMPEQFARQVRLDHGASGFGFPFAWNTVPALAELAPRVLSGVLVDTMIGGNPIEWAGGPERMDAGCFLAHARAWGLPVGRLRRLLRREVFGDAVDERLERMQTLFRESGPTPHQRAMRFHWSNRTRFQAGALPWIDSFAAWPALPIDSRAAVDLALSLDPHHIQRRRLEGELLRRHHPAVARIPVDRNGFDTTPLLPSWRWRLERGSWRAASRSPKELRRYYRLFDVNHSSWRAVRRAFEDCRRAADDLFHPETLRELLPGPDDDVPWVWNPIFETSGATTLLGVLLWCREHR